MNVKLRTFVNARIAQVAICLLFCSTFCAFPKSAKTTTQKQLLAHTYGIIFNTRVIKMLKQKDTTYIYPVLAYQPTIFPIYENIRVVGLDPKYKNMPTPIIIPDSLRHFFDYLSNVPLDSIYRRKEKVMIYSPLMPTVERNKYVMQKTMFWSEPASKQSRFFAILFDYYYVKADSCKFLEREEREIGGFSL